MHAVSFTLLLAASSPVAANGVATGPPAPVPPAASSPSAEPPAPPAASEPPSPTPSAGPSPSPNPSATNPSALGGPRDRAANLVGGVWDCETIAGSTGTHTYTENEDDGSIELQTELHSGDRTFRIRETYRYDDARKVWAAQTEGNAYAGTAPPWTAYKWVFDGVELLRGQRRQVRMVYFDLGDQAFRRDFQARQGGTWQTYSAETCRRPSN